MNTRLNHVQDWLALARQAGWSVTNLAKLCNVSPRTLERHFLKCMGVCPKNWLSEERQRRAIQLLCEGLSVKETAASLGYRHAHNFSQEFKKYWNCCPTHIQIQSESLSMHLT